MFVLWHGEVIERKPRSEFLKRELLRAEIKKMELIYILNIPLFYLLTHDQEVYIVIDTNIYIIIFWHIKK